MFYDFVFLSMRWNLFLEDPLKLVIKITIVNMAILISMFDD